MDEENEIVALIAETIAGSRRETNMGRAAEVLAMLEEVGWEISWRDPGPDPGLELNHPVYSDLEHKLMESLEKAFGKPATILPFNRWS